MKTLLMCLLSSLLLGLSGCSSQDPTTGTTTVSGQVVENQTRKPVPNATVQVYLASTAGGYRAVGAGFPADAQGRFSFDFETAQKSGYLLLASAPPGYITDWALAPSLTAGRKNDNLIIPTYAPAWVKIKLVDESPKSRVVIHTQGYEGAGDTFYYPRDTTVVRPVLAGIRYGLLWAIDGNGPTVTNNTYIQPTALDTVTVRIPF